MLKPARRFSLISVILAAATLMTASLAPAAQASAQSLYSQPKYAAIVVDAASGEVLYARRADQPRYPASITKVMTLYLVFEALATGRLSLNDQVVMSRHAASQPPSKSGLRPGEAISVDTALRVTALKSANDVAVALAEKVGGSEARFAALMTLRAQELGMTNTRFVNAHGLPDSRQITTARDIAILSRAVMRDYPQYYSYFGQRTVEFRGQRINNHNSLLHKMPGVDGIKTGFTNAAGYNLAASAVRDGRRLITVVLGGVSTASRDENVEDLLNSGFDVLTKRKIGQTVTVAANMREPDDLGGPITRASTEQGSGEQAGLRIELADGQARASEGAIDGGPSNSWLAQASASAGSELRAGSGLKAATLALSDSDRELAPDCVKTPVKVRLKATRHRKARTITRINTVCKSATKDAVQVVVASDCPKAVPAGGRTAKAAAACKGESTAEKAGLKPGDLGAGDYRIQVGAFDTKTAAQEHISRITKRYGAVVSSASSQVQPATKGAFRARFNGFSAQGAKAACAALEAKGERCLVLAPS